MKKLKIGITGTRGIPNHYGGFEQFAQYLSTGLRQRGHEVWVYNTHNHPYREDIWNGVHIIHCKDWEYKLGTAGQFLYDRNCLHDAAKREFDILLHLGYTSDSVWHHRWPKKAVNIINMDGLEWQRKKYNRLTKWFLKKAEALAAKHGDILVADSQVIQQYLEEKYNKKASFIPYAAELFTKPDAGRLNQLSLQPNSYYLLIARMVPENNIETVISGYLASSKTYPLVIIGNTSNRFGKHLVSKYKHPSILFPGAVYDEALLNNLRYHCSAYFHGHSAGGTNPSLLEAMACGCNIIAHDNPFNRAVLGDDADYFKNESAITALLDQPADGLLKEKRKKSNAEKITRLYGTERIIAAYETLMLNAVT